MKRLLNTMLLLFAMTFTAVAQDYAEATFKETTHNFGTIKESKGPVTYKFEFTNTGNKPLIVTNATASCGCTKPEYPTKPIKPGKKGHIKVTFSPVGRAGAFKKTIKVKTNGKEVRTSLVIEGTIIPAKREKE
ncbi:MAG: DUF1573 domain-containing protein [Muribaculaceae bacterium]|nr:DUF1573 domain-containing protein [Muribaculaceae bacterium]